MSWPIIFAPLMLAFNMSSAAPIPQEVEAETKSESQAAPDIIDIGIDRQKRMTVPVSIDGNGPYKFMIDTGSERTVVTRELADDLQLEFAARARLLSVAGEKVVDTVYVPELELGRQNYGEVVAPLLESRNVGAEGILGLDGLQDQRILFNFAESRIEVEDRRKKRLNSGYEIVVYAKRRNGQLIFTDATISGVRVSVVIDTGSQANIGNRALQEKLRGRKAKGLDLESSITAVTGQVITADAGIGRDFRIGKAQFDAISIAFADAPPFKALGLDDKPALFLGMASLRGFDRMAIDFKKRRVYFDVVDARR
ncbi:retroviral-like aspartic protease family protein [Sphingorhabdus sp. Alg239-R122]|uniref:retroviral-like aspartic protease family protein n=1 Tax=Sphingorhabdus sp. Alg239-R122 TaxID=2305989 RepID=UPI0013DCF3CC|nr:retroviral-like aspartic protease family protein [Sphingorhabdus sp. Alg239-R122]